jgi:hypothetical protein
MIPRPEFRGRPMSSLRSFWLLSCLDAFDASPSTLLPLVLYWSGGKRPSPLREIQNVPDEGRAKDVCMSKVIWALTGEAAI